MRLPQGFELPVIESAFPAAISNHRITSLASIICGICVAGDLPLRFSAYGKRTLTLTSLLAAHGLKMFKKKLFTPEQVLFQNDH
jgi:hypothetical protein